MRETRVRAIRPRASSRSSGGKRQRLVADDFDRRTALAEHDHRTEGRIVGDADNELARLRPQDHRKNRDAGDARLGPRRPRLAENVRSGLTHRGARW